MQVFAVNSVRVEGLTLNWGTVWGSMRRRLHRYGNIRSRSPRRPTGCPGPLPIGLSGSSAQHKQEPSFSSPPASCYDLPPRKKDFLIPQPWTKFQELLKMKQKWAKYKEALDFCPFAYFNAYSAFPLDYEQLVLSLSSGPHSACLSANCIMLYLAGESGIFLRDPKSILWED